MTRIAFLLPLALLGLSSTAFAGIDDVAASMLDTSAHEVVGDDVQSRTTTTQSRSRGNKSQTRQRSSNNSGSKQARRRTSSNGNNTRGLAQGRSRSQSSSSTNYGNGDRDHRQDTSVKLRQERTRSNGTKSVSKSRGANLNQTHTQGVAGGEHYRSTSRTANVRAQDVGHNGKSGRTKTRASQARGQGTVARHGGTKTADSRAVSRSTTRTDTRAGARPARPGGGPVVTNPGRPTSRRPSATRPSASRPGSARPGTVRPSSARPSTRVVHTSSRPSRAVVHSYSRGSSVHYTHVRPYHGVFVYGPRPVNHNHYSAGPAQVSQKHMPERTLDRDNSFAVGLKMGALASGYHDGGAYSDLGVGLAGRYRPAESVGLQLDVTHHTQSWAADTDRSQTMAAGSVQLFAFPWSRVSPYALGGVTYDARNIQDDIYRGDGTATVLANDSLWGLHGGLGIELALGQSLALDIEGRYIGYLDRSPTDPSLPAAVQVTGGLMVHF